MFSQQQSVEVHVETWAGGQEILRLSISQAKEIQVRCAGSVFTLRTSFFTPELPGQGSEIRTRMGWTQAEKTEKSGLWWFPGALRRQEFFPVLCAAVDWGEESVVHFLVFLFIRVWTRHSYRATCWCAVLATAHQDVEGIAPLMKPWCAEVDLPTAANLNLHWGCQSRVGWHSDEEPLFGGSGMQKLIVSVSFGTQAVLQWKGKSCSDGEAHLCRLGHGDILVMDGQRSDEFLLCTNLVWIRSGLTLLSVGSNSMLPPVLCGQG